MLFEQFFEGMADAFLIGTFALGPWLLFRYRNYSLSDLPFRRQYPQIVVEPSTENVDESSCQNCLP